MNQFRKGNSIRGKLLFLIMLVSGLALLLSSLAFVLNDWTTTKTDMKRNLQIQAEIVGNNSAAALVFGDEANARRTLEGLKAEKEVEAACIYDSNNQVFTKYFRDKNKPGSFPSKIEEEGVRFLGDKLVLFKVIFLDRQKIGTLYIQADMMEFNARFYKYAAIGAVILSK